MTLLPRASSKPQDSAKWCVIVEAVVYLLIVVDIFDKVSVLKYTLSILLD